VPVPSGKTSTLPTQLPTAQTLRQPVKNTPLLYFQLFGFSFNNYNNNIK
jgi:hypothetical protein